MSKKSEEELNQIRESNLRIMKAAIEEMGGAADAARKLANRGVAPIDLAIEMLGGKKHVAEEIFHVTRQTLDDWLSKPFSEWKHGYLQILEEQTKIPMNVLTSAPIKIEPLKTKRNGR